MSNNSAVRLNWGTEAEAAPSPNYTASGREFVRIDSSVADQSTLSTITHQPSLEEMLDARRASRALVRQLPASDRALLYQEHRDLTSKMFVSSLSAAETRRLRYVRWRLDRIEDAEIGDTLDEFEVVAIKQNRLARQIQEFVEQARTATANATGARRKAR